MRSMLNLLLLPALAGGASLAQPPLSEQRPGLADALTQIQALPVEQRLGVRAALIKRARFVIPDVVIVSDEASYLQAISAWTPGAIFPVLWDDASVRSGEDIARFVRAFDARSVVRFSADAGDSPATREGAIAAAWSRAAGAQSDDKPDAESDALALRSAQGVTPPGLVVTSADDPAWPAALALAAGRFQPVRFIDRPRGSVSAALSLEAGEALSTQIQAFARDSGLGWDAKGDDLDAITLCLNGPIKIKTADQPRTFVALTDRLGRLGEMGSGERWAWCGQVTGDEPASVYRAMCALFMETPSAWLFDGYPATAEWATFDATAAAGTLRKGDIQTVLHDTPRQGATDWRMGTLRPLDAGLIMVNTKGNADFFDLTPGRAAPGDAPFLARPAIVHFVHSWSLGRAGDRNTVGGRWLERGAYAYLGSVQEPYLQAFVPTPALAGRLLAGLPWGAAARVDSGPVWRLALLGDPLITLSPAGFRSEDKLPIEVGALSAGIAPHLAQGRFARAMRELTLLGRDEDAARLARGLLNDRPDDLTPDAIAAAIPALGRTGDHKNVIALAARLPDISGQPILHDLAWQSARVLIATRKDDGSALGFMRANIRSPQLVRDADEIGQALKRAANGRSAAAFVTSLTARAANERERQSLEKMASEFASGKR